MEVWRNLGLRCVFFSKEWTGLLAKQRLHLFVFVFVVVCLYGRVCICLGGNIGCDSPLNAYSASPRWRPTCTLHLEVGPNSTWRWVHTPPGGGSTLHLHLDPRTYLGHVGILTIGHFGMFGREQIANQVKRSARRNLFLSPLLSSWRIIPQNKPNSLENI